MKCNAEAYEGLKPYIFVSYSHDDEMRVFPYIEMLAKNGGRIWYDEGITPGDEWPEVIAGHLERCAVVIAVITESSMSSHNCRREINYAISLNKEIICLYVDDVELSSALAMLLSNTQAIRRCNYSLAEEIIGRIMQNETVKRCFGEARKDIEVFNRIQDGDTTVTMTQTELIPEAVSYESVLIRITNLEEIRIKKSLFSVGRSEEHSDYALKGDPSISRRHMTIKKSGDHYCIIDNESLNHVILNGRMIKPDREYDLKSYDVIFLAREAMLFIEDYNSDLIPAKSYVLKSKEESSMFKIKSIARIGSRDSGSSGAGCEVYVSKEDAEPEHCFLLSTPEGLYIVQTALINNIRVNGRIIPFGQKVPVRHGDKISIGKKEFELNKLD